MSSIANIPRVLFLSLGSCCINSRRRELIAASSQFELVRNRFRQDCSVVLTNSPMMPVTVLLHAIISLAWYLPKWCLYGAIYNKSPNSSEVGERLFGIPRLLAWHESRCAVMKFGLRSSAHNYQSEFFQIGPFFQSQFQFCKSPVLRLVRPQAQSSQHLTSADLRSRLPDFIYSDDNYCSTKVRNPPSEESEIEIAYRKIFRTSTWKLGLKSPVARHFVEAIAIADPTRESTKNVLNQQFNALRPSPRWACENPYIRTKSGLICLAAILDRNM